MSLLSIYVFSKLTRRGTQLIIITTNMITGKRIGSLQWSTQWKYSEVENENFECESGNGKSEERNEKTKRI